MQPCFSLVDGFYCSFFYITARKLQIKTIRLANSGLVVVFLAMCNLVFSKIVLTPNKYPLNLTINVNSNETSTIIHLGPFVDDLRQTL